MPQYLPQNKRRAAGCPDGHLASGMVEKRKIVCLVAEKFHSKLRKLAHRLGRVGRSDRKTMGGPTRKATKVARTVQQEEFEKKKTVELKSQGIARLNVIPVAQVKGAMKENKNSQREYWSSSELTGLCTASTQSTTKSEYEKKNGGCRRI